MQIKARRDAEVREGQKREREIREKLEKDPKVCMQLMYSSHVPLA